MSLVDTLTYRIVEVSHDQLGPFEIFYFGFNALEAVAWFTFATIVLVRWSHFRKSWLELMYSLLFVLFGISDVIEIFIYPLWLLIAKAAILVSLLLARRHLVQNHYSGRKF